VVLGASDVRRAAAFSTRALGYVPREEVSDDWVVLVPAPSTGSHNSGSDRTGAQVSIGRSETPVQEHPRVHLDLYAGDAADQAAEVDRLVALDADFIVLADTEGNRFCVIDTSHGA
jgi:hypothetical protein